MTLMLSILALVLTACWIVSDKGKDDRIEQAERERDAWREFAEVAQKRARW